MVRSLMAVVAVVVCVLGGALAEPKYNGFPMEMYRMCTSFHSEVCGPDATPPGPCLDPNECRVVACSDERIEGSCTKDSSLSWCEDAGCPFLVRQAVDPLGKLSQRIVKKFAS